MPGPTDGRFPHHNTPTPIAGVVVLVAVAVVVGSVTAVVLLEFGTRATSTAPIADFDFAYDADAAGADAFGHDGSGFDGKLTITHTDGHRFDAANLYVTDAASLPGPRSWADSPGYDPNSTVQAGSTLTVWVSRDDTVSLVWIDPAGDRSARIETWRGPR